MSEADSALKVVVAADTSMSRDVVRFFLQASDEITIVAEAASADDAAWMADKYGADAVVLHSGIAFDAVQDAVIAIRAAAPRARIVVVTPEGGGVPLPVDSRGADSYLEEGVGLADLAFVLTSLCRSPDIAIDLPPTFRAPERTDPIIVVPEPELVMAGAPPGTASSRPLATPTAEPRTEDQPVASAASPSRRAGFLPLLAAASAFVIAVAFAMYRTPLENALFPDHRTHFAGVDAGSRASDFLRSSHMRLDALAHSLDRGDATTAPALARQLVAERQRILASGGDVSALDREIETTLRPMVRDAPAGVAVAVLAVIAPVASWANGDLNNLLLNGGPGVSPPPPANAGDSSGGGGGSATGGGTGGGVDVGGVPSGGTTGTGDGGTSTGDTGGTGTDTGGSGGGNTGGSGGQDGGGPEGGGPGGDGDADGTGTTDGDGSTSSGGDASGGGGTTEGGQGAAGDGTQAGASGEDAQGDTSGPGGEGDAQRGDPDGCEPPGRGGGKAYGHCNRPIKRHR
jgi:hypothetical protein